MKIALLGALILNTVPLITRVVTGYTHPRCTRRIAADFSFDDCYLPSQNPDLLFTSASFVFSHNTATGQIKSNKLSKAGLSWWYSKDQIGTAYQQLSDGARALDLRILYKANVLANNGTVASSSIVFHHGSVQITTVTFEELLQDVVRWCQDNPDELVLLLPSHFAYDVVVSSSSSDDDYTYGDDGGDYSSFSSSYSLVSSMQAIYQQYGVAYVHCSDVYGLTVGEVMELSQLDNNEGGGGGYLLALDYQDGSSACMKENWIPDDIVTCYPETLNVTCKSSSQPFELLKTYALASVHNEATDYKYTNGPPSNLYRYPLNEIQAFWQTDGHAVAAGLRHGSSILQDNRGSNLNAELVGLIYSGAFENGNGAVSLFAVDNVALHGNAILSVLRNTCGQSVVDDETTTACGNAVPPPRMTYLHLTTTQIVAFALVIYLVVAVLTAAWVRRQQQLHGKKWKLHKFQKKVLQTMADRLQDEACGPQIYDDAISSRSKPLL